MKSPENDKQGRPRPDGQKLCPKCGKRIALKTQAGDLATHLFQDFDCSCASKDQDRAIKTAKKHSNSDGQSRPSPLAKTFSALASSLGRVATLKRPATVQTAKDSDDFCPRCGLQIAAPSLPGSLTGYLFQDTRCKCTPEADFAQGAMTGKFWQLKQAGLGTTFTNLGQEGQPQSGTTIDLASGAIIGGAYRIIEAIGRGGMGEVYLAEHLTLHKKCALKLIPPDQVTELGWRRFQLEAKAIAKLDHINLVKVSDLGIHEGCLPFYAMEFVEGDTLADMLAQYGPMPLNTSIEIFSQICDGVDHAHRAGIIHRDLKPANIMVSKSASGKTTVKILDFGLAKLTQQNRDKQSLTAVGDVFGSPLYMSPEQCSGDKIDTRSDVYSLGCTFFECLTGQTPFTGHLASQIVFSHQEADPPTLESKLGPKVLPESMEVVMAKLLRKNPVERYQTLSELKGDLQRVAKGKSVQPFYMSRGKSADSAKTQPSEVPAKASLSRPDRRGITLKKGGLLFAPIILLTGGWLAFNSFKVAPKPPTVTPKNVQKEESGEMLNLTQRFYKKLSTGKTAKNTVIAARLDSLGPIVRKIDTAQGTITFKCPHFSLGRITWRKGGKNQAGFDASTSSEGKVDVRGDVTVPNGVELTYKLGEQQVPEVWRHPSFLSCFGNDYFTGLYLGGLADKLIFSGEAESEADANQVTELIKIASGWTTLNALELHNCVIREEAIAELDKIKNLRQFTLSYPETNAKSLARRPFIKNLQRLILHKVAESDCILSGLEGSSAIKEVQLQNTIYSARGLKSLSTCPSLILLELHSTKLDDSVLNALGTIKSLKYLKITELHLTAPQIRQLARLNRLDSITFSAAWFSSSEQLAIRKVIPQAKFERSLSVKGNNASDLSRDSRQVFTEAK